MSSLIQFFHGVFNMNLTYRKPLVAAIAAAIGSFAPLSGVMAEPIKPVNSSATPVVYQPVYIPLEAAEKSIEYYSAYEVGVGATTDALKNRGHLDAYIYTIPGYPVSANKTLVVKVALTNGATFADKPYIVCPMSGANTPSSVSALTYANVSATDALATDIAAGDASLQSAYAISPSSYSATMTAITFEFPQGFNTRASESGACLLTYSANLVMGAASTVTAYLPAIKGKSFGQDVSMNVTITYQDLFNSASTFTTIPIIKPVTALKVEAFKFAEVSTSAAYAQIDVKKLSKEFIDKSNNNSNIAFAGELQISPGTAMSLLRAASGRLLSAADILTTATITISGPTVASLSKISFVKGANPVNCAGTVYGDAVPNTPVAASGTASSSSSNGEAKVSFISTSDGYKDLLGAVTAGAAYSGLHVCLVGTGSNVMSEGPLTVTIMGSKSSAETELGTGELVTVTKNGTVVRVLNIPGVKSADRGFVRFYNTGNQEFAVSGTLYGEDGKPIGTEGMTLFASLKPNDVKVLDRAALEALAGNKTWDGRAWLMIQAPISSNSFKVVATVRSANGVLTNVSSDAMD